MKTIHGNYSEHATWKSDETPWNCDPSITCQNSVQRFIFTKSVLFWRHSRGTFWKIEKGVASWMSESSDFSCACSSNDTDKKKLIPWLLLWDVLVTMQESPSTVLSWLWTMKPAFRATPLHRSQKRELFFSSFQFCCSYEFKMPLRRKSTNTTNSTTEHTAVHLWFYVPKSFDVSEPQKRKIIVQKKKQKP